MTRLMKVVTAVLALGSVPALAADTGALVKDRAHEAEIRARMEARSHKKMDNNDRANQAADASRVGGARASRYYHGAVHSTRKGIHHLSKKTEKATK